MARSGSVDPLEKFRFRISWGTDQQATALVRMGFHDVQMPKRSTNKIAYRTGEDLDIMTQSAGLSSMEDIVMSRGLISGDDNNEMYKWMSSVHTPSASREADVNSRVANAASHAYRKDITVQMLDREGIVVRAWKLYQAWPVNFVPGADLNAAEDGDKSLEQLTLTYEDFQELAVAAGVVGNAK